MRRRSRRLRLAGCIGLAWMALAACGDSHRADVKRHARAWVDRRHDTTSVDSLAHAQADSAWIDSLSATFTTDDWLYFWHEVERAQAQRK